MLSIAESRALGPILNEIVGGVASAFDLALSRLWLIESDADCRSCRGSRESTSHALHLRASAGRSASSDIVYDQVNGAFHRIELGQRKIGEIARSGTAMLIPNVTGEEDWVADRNWVRREGIQSFAGQPLLFRGQVLGVLAVFGRAAFSSDDFRWLRTFADHAAVAIANARAYEELTLLKSRLEEENEYLHAEIREALPFGDIVGNSPSLRTILEQVALVADTSATVLIQGESGTGKELIARAIHERSSRRQRPFIKVNCAAIPRELFESEFFGHVKGAFTGAIKDRIGRFQLAHTGTLFLDEIAEIPAFLQPKLLRVLQEQQFETVGDARTRSVDVRVLAATNRDLRRDVEQDRFREDLYYRLSVFPMQIPPLRERREDIPLLALHFLRKSATRVHWSVPPLSRENMRQLQNYNWPGNIRELENVIERAAILARNSRYLRFDLPTASAQATRAPATSAILTRAQLREQEKESILAALRQSNGKVFGRGGAAEILGVRPTTLASRLKALGLKRTFFPDVPEK
jgi:transcriptional regulator with GAF, ATPase, and Fis domain